MNGQGKALKIRQMRVWEVNASEPIEEVTKPQKMQSITIYAMEMGIVLKQPDKAETRSVVIQTARTKHKAVRGEHRRS